MVPYHQGQVEMWNGDCREVLAGFEPDTFDSCVTDPPYHFASIVNRFGAEDAAPTKGPPVFKRHARGFMGKTWDGGQIAHEPETWAGVLRVLKPGAHLVAFHSPKNWHRCACAIEDAGFEIRDCLMWLFGSGFPKSHNVSKAIDRVLGREREVIGEGAFASRRVSPNGGRTTGDFEHNGHELTAPASEEAAQWDGWGTALKPAYEPIILARKPLIGTVAENVLKHGTGGINVQTCRVAGTSKKWKTPRGGICCPDAAAYAQLVDVNGRWPANVAHDGSPEVVKGFPQTESIRAEVTSKPGAIDGAGRGLPSHTGLYGFDDKGSAARFFYTAKADADDRIGSRHPTVKPLDLMQWLVRLVTPPRGRILDPFAGTGTTAEAALREGFNATLIEREAESLADIDRRMALAFEGKVGRSVAMAKLEPEGEPLPLFEILGGET